MDETNTQTHNNVQFQFQALTIVHYPVYHNSSLSKDNDNISE